MSFNHLDVGANMQSPKCVHKNANIIDIAILN